jgi:hypothetical protein
MQVALSKWPIGLCREIATIDSAAIVTHLADRLSFERAYDDLDQFSAAVFETGGGVLALHLYDNIPTGDFTLIAMDETGDDLAALNVFLAWSGIPDAAVKWRRPATRE